ncbi:hypothetical protein DXG01_016077 [Tephrocybe rancida]|nr:hypothetical protein DXG01_016077 [Tephrocybe rancida]
MSTSNLFDDARQHQDDLHTPQAAAAAYDRLEKRISTLDHELGQFVAECRQLGRSYALILTTRDLREGLENLLSVFHENASHLAPSLSEIRRPLNVFGNDQPFYFWLEALSKACDAFRERLSEFREYTDESAKVKALMLNFSRDLMVWTFTRILCQKETANSPQYRSSCLEGHKGIVAFVTPISSDLDFQLATLDTTYMRYYVNDLADEMGKDLDNLVSAVTFFNRYGMPAMQYEQRRDTEILLGVSTISTFFSAVTATTLQISLSIQGNSQSSLLFVVNTFWFFSLVLSIGAALNSLLAVVWKRTPYGSRGRRLPIWVTLWIHTSAPAFLAISIAAFSAGLALFAYCSGQKSHTKVVTLVATAITSFGVITIASWLGYEQWVAPLLLPDAPWRPFGKRIHEWKASLSEKSTSRLALIDHRRNHTGSLSDYSSGSTRSRTSSFNFIPHRLAARLPADLLNKVPGLRRSADFVEHNRSIDIEAQTVPSPTATDSPDPTQTRWRRGVKLITTLKSATTKAFKQGTQSVVDSPINTEMMPTSARVTATSTSRPSIPSISDRPLLTLSLPLGSIQDLEYSPNGQYLAATSYDGRVGASTTIIYTVNQEHIVSTGFTHVNRASKHLSWSLNSQVLLIRLSHGVDFLDENCLLLSNIKRPHPVESASWPVEELSGHGHFIGEDDEMMACVGMDGDVHIWNRETIEPVGRIPAGAIGNGARCFAWSTASAMFASADDATKELKIWSSIQPNQESEERLPAAGTDLATQPETHAHGSTTGLSALLGAVTFDERLSSMNGRQ